MKGSYFGFGSPQQQVDMHARSKKLSFSYNMHLFFPYLLNDSQMIGSTIHFSKPLLCVTLIYGDWSDWSISYKAVFVRMCTAVTGETAIFNAPKAAPSGKELICIFIQTNVKIKFSQVCANNKWAGNMLMFHVDINMKRLGIHFNNDSFQWFGVDSFFWETITLYTVHFQI